MNEKDFSKLNTARKYLRLREASEFLGSRYFAGYQVALYRIEDFYVEAYFRFGFKVPEFIEIPTLERIAEYAPEVRASDLF